MTRPLWSLTAAELTAGYRAGQFTPCDALDAIETRIDAVNGQINAIIARDPALAKAQAEAATERWQTGTPLSAIDGVPMTIKDGLMLAGLPASWGSALYAGFVPAQDEAPVARLRRAGAVFLGKTNVPEFTVQGYTDNRLFGASRNPHALTLTPGGSTGGGAAAVAAGLGPIAIGTDAGGSLRRPAAHCGLYALKPSLGQVGRHGGFPAFVADFDVVGPIARSAEDLALVFSVLKGTEVHDIASLAASAPSRPLPVSARIAFLPSIGVAPVDPAIRAAAEATAARLRALGHVVETVAVPYDAERAAAAWGILTAAGMHWFLNEAGRPDGLGDNALALDQKGQSISAADYIGALDTTAAARREAAAFFETFDLLLMPSIAALAWPAEEAYPDMIDGQPVGPRGHAAFTGWVNMAGLCAANIPVAMTAEQGGIGMQLVASAGRDSDLLAFLTSQAWPLAGLAAL